MGVHSFAHTYSGFETLLQSITLEGGSLNTQAVTALGGH